MNHDQIVHFYYGRRVRKQLVCFNISAKASIRALHGQYDYLLNCLNSLQVCHIANRPLLYLTRVRLCADGLYTSIVLFLVNCLTLARSFSPATNSRLGSSVTHSNAARAPLALLPADVCSGHKVSWSIEAEGVYSLGCVLLCAMWLWLTAFDIPAASHTHPHTYDRTCPCRD